CGACRYCVAGDYQRCPAIRIVGVTIPGGFADYLPMPARHCFRIPHGVRSVTAALSQPPGVAVHGVRLSGLEMGQRVLVLGAFTKSPTFPALFVLVKELRILGSLVYGRAGARADFDIALDLLRRHGPRIAETLITHRFPLDRIDDAFRTAADKTTGSIKVTI